MKDEEIVELFFDVTRLNRRFSDSRNSNLNPFRGQYRCLTALNEAGTINQKRLAEILAVRSASVGEILLKLEQKGWILRQPSPQDKRTTLISLTEEGKKQAQRIRRERAAFHSGMVSTLTESEKESFSLLLRKIKQYYLSVMEVPSHE